MCLYIEQSLVFQIFKILICLYIGAAPISEIIGYEVNDNFVIEPFVVKLYILLVNLKRKILLGM